MMFWCRIGNKPLPEAMLTRLTDTYICGTRGRWVNCCLFGVNPLPEAMLIHCQVNFEGKICKLKFNSQCVYYDHCFEYHVKIRQIMIWDFKLACEQSVKNDIKIIKISKFHQFWYIQHSLNFASNMEAPYTNCRTKWFFTLVTSVMTSQWDGNLTFNTLRPRQTGCHFADDVFKGIFLNENVWILLQISLKFVPKGPIDNIPSLVQIMAWRRPGDKPLSEPMTISLLMHICVARPQWVNPFRMLRLTPQIQDWYLYFMDPQIFMKFLWYVRHDTRNN